MSRSRRSLSVTSGPIAEITVLDGSMYPVGRSIGSLVQDLPQGIYKIRVRNGSAVIEDLVSLDEDRLVHIDVPGTASAIPLQGAPGVVEDHASFAARASREPKYVRGAGASIFIFCRQPANEPPGLSFNPAAGLAISDVNGKLVGDLENQSIVDRTGYRWTAAWCATVDPGAYTIASRRSDGRSIERALFVSKDVQTQLFLVSRALGSDGRPEHDIAGGAIVLSPKGFFDPTDDGLALGEVARYALAHDRHILTPALLNRIIGAKFAEPTLGLIGAHLLLRDRPGETGLFETVISNLIDLLGQDHPDIQALSLRRPQRSGAPRTAIGSPPMLTASWNVAIRASLSDPDVFAESNTLKRVAAGLVAAESWLAWEAYDQEEHDGGSDRTAAVLRNYLVARDRADAVRSVSARPTLTRKRLVGGAKLPTAVADRGRGPAFSAFLDEGERADLATALGVPGAILDAALKGLANN